MNRHRQMQRRWLGGLMLAQSLLTIGVPLSVIVCWSFSDGWLAPALLPQHYTFAHWQSALGESSLTDAAWNSLVIALAVTACATLFAVAPAWLLVRLPDSQRRKLEFIVLCPLIVPGIVIAPCIGKVLIAAHLDYTWAGVVLAQTTGILPLMIKILASRFETVPGELVHAARSLGASTMRIMWHILLPASKNAIFAGALIALATSLEEFDKTFVAGAPNVQTLPVHLYFQLDGAGILFPAAAVASLILLMPGLLIFIVAARSLELRAIVDNAAEY
ncbi:MAG TPA: ABC transporter permease [Burkholderiaceae bacterium]